MSLQNATIAANRFGFGARPGDLSAIAKDPRDWLLAQLSPVQRLPAPLRDLPPSHEDLLYEPLASAQREVYRRFDQQGRKNTGAMLDAQALSKAQRREEARRAQAASEARLAVAVGTDSPFRERLVHFWSNHFSVSGTSRAMRLLPPAFERDVVRPRVTGSFADLLRAATQHPAMQRYLDNHHSVGPSSYYAEHPQAYAHARSGPRRKTLGLNENHAREILELHTVGVGGGYDQDDVEQFARALTGWGVREVLGTRDERRARLRAIASDANPLDALAKDLASLRDNYRKADWTTLFYFDARAHEPGAVDVLGKRYAHGGVAQAQAILDDLATHPSTADFIATKLCTHFIADAPPGPAVARVARAFRKSDGDLTATYRALLLECPQAWDGAPRKFKRPEEYLVSVLRALEVPPTELRPFVRAIRVMGQGLYLAPGPDGWSDLEAHWASPDGVWKRMEWASRLAERTASATREVGQLGAQVLGSAYSKTLARSVASASSPAQALSLLLLCPEFMRR
ncbi:MAG: DUF1800 domain-containing protein [Pseudomonadota bacterium]